MNSSILDKIETDPSSASTSDLVELLNASDAHGMSLLHAAARRVKISEVGPVVYLRGLLELSNICAKDCRYCGIRQSNPQVKRYQLSLDEVADAAHWACENNFASLVLQAGERRSPAFVSYIEAVLNRIHEATDGELTITLSLGEQSHETYARWREAGAHRYLLRVETSNPSLYKTLHPKDHIFDERLLCLARLRETGFQVGSGVLIGIPNQKTRDLADDLMFFKQQDIDMVGMGPFIPHDDTPMAKFGDEFDPSAQLKRGLNMIAVARLFLRDVNIASTTALEALAPRGRELGLLAGANVVMPNLTPVQYREGYQLYRGKPGMAEDTGQSLLALENMVNGIGETIGYGHAGNSLHYRRRIKG